MLAPNELARFAEVCTLIGNEVADEHGFVPVRNLLTRFQASLLIRPLLVEGMLASKEHHSGTSFDATRWAVLLDSETYQVSELEIKEESQERPLPSRLRNTVAHELVHSLAFRPSEFGIRLREQNDSEERQIALVRAIERETEQLSPLLLWSDKALMKVLSGRKRSLSVEELHEICRTVGISRYVLISRLRLLRSTDPNGFLHRDGLKNIAIGIGEWVDGRNAVLRSWPVFINFDRNIVPAFLLKLIHQDRLPATTVFAHEAFAMCGGRNNNVEFITDAGVETVPNAMKMKVECSMEPGNKKTGSDFLYVIRKLDEK